MTIASEIQRIQNNIANTYDALEAKGATMPATENSNNLASTVATIPAGGGDTITAVNKTGSAISEGDKVWIQKQTVAAGYYSEPNSASYTANCFSGISNDGNYFSYSNGSTNCSLWYINDLSTNSFTNVGNNLIYLGGYRCGIRYSNLGDTFIFTNYTTNTTTSMKTSKLGNNSFQTNYQYNYLGYDVFGNGNTASSGTKMLELGDLNAGTFTTLTSTQSATGYVGVTGIAISQNDVYNLHDSTHFTLDRANLTYSLASITENNINCEFCIGATSDSKIIIAVNIHPSQPESTNPAPCKRFQFIKVDNSNNVVTGYNIDEYLERLKPLTINTEGAYFFSFNPNNDIFTVSGYSQSSNPVYGFFKYDTTTETWSEIYVDLSSVLSDATYLCGQITVSEDMTRIGVPVSVSGDSAGYSRLRIVQLQAVSGYKYVPYNYYDITSDVLTGFASENIAVDAEGDAATVLPQKLSVSVTVDTNDATIFVE